MPRQRSLTVLKKRPAFLAVAASGKKWVTPGLIVQARQRSSEALPALQTCRFGLTASKRVGNAVLRNRARRRLRALAQEILADHGLPDYDYVLIARPSTVTRKALDLRNDFVTALKRMKLWREKTS